MTTTPRDPQFDPYAVLGVSPADTAEQIARAYRALVREHHPDTRPHDSHATEHEATLRSILLAYAMLTDPNGHHGRVRPETPTPRVSRPVADYQDPPVVIGTFDRTWPSTTTPWLIAR